MKNTVQKSISVVLLFIALIMPLGLLSGCTYAEISESGISYTYPKFTPDIEHLSKKEMLEINKAYSEYRYDSTYNSYYDHYTSQGKMSESEIHDKAHKYAEGERESSRHSFFNDKRIITYKYYGTFKGSTVLVLEGNLTVLQEYEIAGYTFSYGNYATMYTYNNGKFYALKEAYDLGLLDDEDIGKVYERYLAYSKYEREWRDSMQKAK